MRWLVLLLLLPGSQALSIDVAAPEEPLAPDLPYDLEVAFDVPCEEAIVQPSVDWAIAVEVRTVDGLAVTGPSRIAFEREPCAPGQTLRIQQVYQVTPSMALPAEEPHPVTFTANLSGSQEKTTQEIPVESAFVSIFNATAPVTQKQAGPQKQIHYDVTITNHGNARTMFTFILQEQAGPGQIILPNEAVLDGLAGDVRETTVEVSFATPYKNGKNSAHSEFQMVVRSESAERKTLGVEQPLEFAADTKGFYLPGPAPLAAVAALAILALRRRA